MHSLIYVAHFAIAIAGICTIFLLVQRQALPSGSPLGWARPGWAVGFAALLGGIFELANFKASSPPDRFWDFLNAYYPAGRAALHHDPEMLRALIGKGVSGFVNIPVVAYLFVPFGWLPPLAAVAAFTILGVGLTIAAWFLLIRLANLELRERWLLAFLFLVNGPLLNGIKLGNMSYFILFAFTGALALLRGGRSGAAGMLLGVAAVLKPPLALFGLFFLLRRDLRGLLGFMLVGVATVALSLILFGWADNLHWFEACVVQYSHSWLAAFSVQSIPAFLIRLHAPSNVLLDWSAHVPPAGERILAQILIGSLFLAAAAACLRLPARASLEKEFDAAERRDLQYLLTICLCLISSPLTWAHYYAWLLVPAAFFLGSPSFPRSAPMRALAWLAIALMTPLVAWPWAISNPGLMAVYRSFIVSHLLFSGLLWFGLIAWWLARSGGLLASRRALP